MKTPITKTLTLILTLLPVLSLTARAQNFVVTEDTTINDAQFVGATGYAALSNEGPWTFTGSNLILVGRDDGTYSPYQSEYGVCFDGGAVLNLFNSTVSGTGAGVGIYLADYSVGNVSDTTINLYNPYHDGGYGIALWDFSSGTLNNVNITSAWNGARTHGEGTTLTMTGGSITADGYGLLITGNSSATVSNVDITTTGEQDSVLLNDNATLTLTDSNITGTGYSALYLLTSSTATVNLHNNTLTGDIYVEDGSRLTLNADQGSVINSDIISLSAYHSSIEITLTDAGTAMHGGTINANDGTLTLTVNAGALLDGGGEVTNLTLNDGAILGYTNGLLVTTSITIGDNITIDFSNLTETGDYTVLDWSGASGGESISDDQFTIAGDGVEGTFNVDNGKLTFNATAVPEPSTWFLIGLGLGALALIRRRI
jgi:hypothetical protein